MLTNPVQAETAVKPPPLVFNKVCKLFNRFIFPAGELWRLLDYHYTGGKIICLLQPGCGLIGVQMSTLFI
jgi:hypothetical protein